MHQNMDACFWVISFFLACQDRSSEGMVFASDWSPATQPLQLLFAPNRVLNYQRITRQGVFLRHGKLNRPSSKGQKSPWGRIEQMDISSVFDSC